MKMSLWAAAVTDSEPASPSTLRFKPGDGESEKPHRALSLAPPLAEARDPIPVNPRDVRRRDLLGGLVHEYYGLAA
jgi:hypothetical protein